MHEEIPHTERTRKNTHSAQAHTNATPTHARTHSAYTMQAHTHSLTRDSHRIIRNIILNRTHKCKTRAVLFSIQSTIRETHTHRALSASQNASKVRSEASYTHTQSKYTGMCRLVHENILLVRIHWTSQAHNTHTQEYTVKTPTHNGMHSTHAHILHTFLSVQALNSAPILRHTDFAMSAPTHKDLSHLQHSLHACAHALCMPAHTHSTCLHTRISRSCTHTHTLCMPTFMHTLCTPALTQTQCARTYTDTECLHSNTHSTPDAMTSA